MNATLEAMAQALFKSWFVDFDPVIDNALAAGNPIPEELQAKAHARATLGDKRKPLPEAIQKQFPSRFVFTEEMGWVPEGWEAKSIGKLLELAYGKSLPAAKRKKGAVPVFGSGGISGYHDESLVDGPGIIVGRKGTVGSLFWVEENFFPIDTVFYVVNKTTVPLFWLYQALSLINIEAMAADSAVPGVNRNAVYARHLIVPQRGALGEYCVQIDSYNAKRKELSAQNEVLLQLRDTLLPKLLSGELRIPEAEKLAAEA
jgi:type I restriction enzyme S subunit